jgi:hypothetical protein
MPAILPARGGVLRGARAMSTDLMIIRRQRTVETCRDVPTFGV